jgi:hypothetical protein
MTRWLLAIASFDLVAVVAILSRSSPEPSGEPASEHVLRAIG